MDLYNYDLEDEEINVDVTKGVFCYPLKDSVSAYEVRPTTAFVDYPNKMIRVIERNNGKLVFRASFNSCVYVPQEKKLIVGF